MSYIKMNQPLLRDLSYSKAREILMVNHQGAYYNTTLSTCNTRKYHGMLVVPQPTIDQQPHVLLSHLDEVVMAGDHGYALAVHQYPGVHFPEGQQYLEAFTFDTAPKWIYKMDDIILEKEIILSHLSNRLMIKYNIQECKGKVKLQLRPFVACRNMHTVRQEDTKAKATIDEVSNGIRFHLYDAYRPLYFQHSKKALFSVQPDWYHNFEYQREKERGYEFHESLFVPGFFEFTLSKGDELVFSIGESEVNSRLLKRDFTKEKDATIIRADFESCLQNAAEQFIVTEGHRTDVVAGWPWFGSWSRDTFIALPGLTLATGKPELFRQVMDTMMPELKDGLFPNAGTGVNAAYNSVDAPLWCIWAIQQYAYHTGSTKAVWALYGDQIKDILDKYRKGTNFNIKMTPETGLIHAGDKAHALTWMDAIVDGYPVTPRTGMPVEINALWYNAICFALEAAGEAKDQAFVEDWNTYPSLIQNGFANVFWDDMKGYLADCVDGDHKDWAIRPNQVFALSMPFHIPTQEMGESILKVIENELLTPRGLRTLAPADPEYKATYFGDQFTRDMAYHQGTVWPWLLGHYAQAYLKVHGDSGIAHIEDIYKQMEPAIVEAGLGTVSEVYSGDAPYMPGGTIAQAWSVAELLRIKQLIDQYKTKTKGVNKNRSKAKKELERS